MVRFKKKKQDSTICCLQKQHKTHFKYKINSTQFKYKTYKTYYPIISGYIFFSNAHRTFATMDHILGYKIKLYKFKRIQAIQNILSHTNTCSFQIKKKKKFSVPIFIKLEINNKDLENPQIFIS